MENKEDRRHRGQGRVVNERHNVELGLVHGQESDQGNGDGDGENGEDVREEWLP